jgi:hypothetical protein
VHQDHRVGRRVSATGPAHFLFSIPCRRFPMFPSGGQNAPGLNEPFDGEVCLDIEVIGGRAGRRLVCYFALSRPKGS